MVRNRLSNMGGTSMQRQGSGSSTSKSGRGTSPSLGRTGSGNDVWSWRRQPAQAREYTEEELQKQGVHLTARLSASAGDDHSKWADVPCLGISKLILDGRRLVRGGGGRDKGHSRARRPSLPGKSSRG